MSMPVREWVDRMRAAHARVDHEELARLRKRSQAERVEALQAASRLAQQTLAAMTPELRARALAHRDPLPPSSVRALEMLRARARAKANAHG